MKGNLFDAKSCDGLLAFFLDIDRLFGGLTSIESVDWLTLQNSILVQSS